MRAYQTSMAKTARKVLAFVLSALLVFGLSPFGAAAFATDEAQELPDNSASVETFENSDNPVGDGTELSGEAIPSENISTEEVSAEDISSEDEDSVLKDRSVQAPQPDAVASVGGEEFETLKDAVAAAQPGSTITLLRDANLSFVGRLDISGLTLDLAGHTISAINYTLVFQGGNATIKNGSFDSMGTAYGLMYGETEASENVVFENLNTVGGIRILNTQNAVLRNLDVNATVSMFRHYAISCDEKSQITVESGNYTSDGAAVFGVAANDVASIGQLIVRGGNFYSQGGKPLFAGVCNFKPIISGGTFYSETDIAEYIAEGFCIKASENGRFEVLKKDEENPDQPDPPDKPDPPNPPEERPSTDISVAVPTDTENIPEGMQTATLPPNHELKAHGVTHKEDESIKSALTDESDVKEAFDGIDTSKNLWTVNVVLQNKENRAENHDTEVAFLVGYPEGAIDANTLRNYKFVVLHMSQVEADDAVLYVPEILGEDSVVATKDGLWIKSTLSPFAIGFKRNTVHPVTPGDNTGGNAGWNGGSWQGGGAPGGAGVISDSDSGADANVNVETVPLLTDILRPASLSAGLGQPVPQTNGASGIVRPASTQIGDEPAAADFSEEGLRVSGTPIFSSSVDMTAGFQFFVTRTIWEVIFGSLAVICAVAGVAVIERSRLAAKEKSD